MTKNELLKIKNYYQLNKQIKKYYKHNQIQKNNSYISDDEIVEKINSGDFKKHPLYPIIVKYNGKEIYDLRDNYKIEIMKNKQGSKVCRILGFKRIMVSRITAESWYNKIIKPDENIHHIDENENNNFFKNLRIIKKTKHIELHRKKQKRRY